MRQSFATSVWHRRYMGARSREVEEIAANCRRPDLYLLTDVDVPFVQDGTRDGENISEWMHETFVAELEAQARLFRLLSGSDRERFEAAVGHIDELLTG